MTRRLKSAPLPAMEPRTCSSRHVGDFDEWLALLQSIPSFRKAPLEDLLQMRIGRVATGQPQDLGRCTMTFEHLDEVAVLGNDHSSSSACSPKDLFVPGVPKPKVTDSVGIDAERGSEPDSQFGGDMCVQPDIHPITTGWLSLRLANFKQARMSSGSKSGSSSRICCADSPFANKSRTSVTRILIPLTHGRPPHCSGSTVIRSASCAMPRPPRGVLLIIQDAPEPGPSEWIRTARYLEIGGLRRTRRRRGRFTEMSFGPRKARRRARQQASRVCIGAAGFEPTTFWPPAGGPSRPAHRPGRS